MGSSSTSFFHLWAAAGFSVGLFPYSLGAAEVNLGQLNQEFTGKPISPSVATIPEGLPVAVVYQDLAGQNHGGGTETVFNNTPNQLPLSYASLNLSGQRINALGNYIRLAGTARQLQSCDVTLVTWARAIQYPVLAALNPEGYLHPIRVTLYSVAPDLRMTFLTDVTVSVLIPWRPEVMPDGQPWPFNGYAFRARFDFPDFIVLPEQVMVMVDYSTESSGFTPLGIPGPYNSLNIALDGTPPAVGTDVDRDVVLRVTDETWFYPNTGWGTFSGPGIRLNAGPAVTKTPPVAPGSYRVTAMAETGSTEGTSSGTLTIMPPSLASWRAKEFTSSQIASGQSNPEADADGDGYSNFMEYAVGTSPNNPTTNLPLEISREGFSITLTRPRWLTGVQYMAEESSDLKTWSAVPLEILSSTLDQERVRAAASPVAMESRCSYLRFRFAP